MRSVGLVLSTQRAKGWHPPQYSAGGCDRAQDCSAPGVDAYFLSSCRSSPLPVSWPFPCSYSCFRP